MEKGFNLSDKIWETADGSDGLRKEILRAKDVKEFIKRLKAKINKQLPIEEYCNSNPILLKEINKLAGKELVS